MKKIGLLACLFIAALTATAQSGAKFEQGESATQNKRVSPNGKWLVGESTASHEWGLDALSGYVSFLQNVETGERTWLTSFESGDYNKSGSFTDVTDEGVICGVMKDPDTRITVTEIGYTYTLPLNVGAIWQKDGTLTKLSLGTYTAGDFLQFPDGMFAMAIANDAKTVVGYLSIGNYAQTRPCGWIYNESSKTYDFKEYALPEGYVKGRINDVSGDGKIAVGYCCKDLGAKEACFWISPDKCFVIENTNPVSGVQNDGEAFVISDNGNFIGCTLNGREPVRLVFIDKNNGLYQVKHLGLRDGYSEVTVDGVTDGGDMIGTYKYPVSGLVRPYYYSSSNLANVDFDYFVYFYANDIKDKIPYTFTHYGYESTSFSGMSADGTIIAGNDTYGKPWILTAEQSTLMWPQTVPSITGRASALGEVTVTAQKLMMDPYVYYDAKEFILYRDGKEVKRVAKADLEEGFTEITLVDQGVSKGTHYYSVAVNWTNRNTGEEMLSPRSEEITVNMEGSFDFPLFDDFETLSIQSQSWWVDRHYGEVALQFIGCGQYYGLNWTSYLNYTVFQSQPYSFALVSRHMDARDKESVYMSFARWWGYVNSYDWDLTEDTISVEVSVDDVNWIKVKDLRASEIEANKWGFENIDLTQWAAGQVFQVRLRAHGQALSQTTWRIDDLRIDEKPAHKAVDGIMGINTPDGFRFTWKNSLDAYGLNYFGNRMYNVENRTLGNEGKELIAINKFDRSDLKMYVGKYLTSVTTELYYNAGATKPLRAAIVVYENGQLVREQEILEPQYNIWATYKLDESLQIKDDSELWIGIKLIEYDAALQPIRYQNTSDFADGKSNIYSEDNGNTWLNLADYYEQVPGHETDGYGSWLITANVTDAPEASKDKVDLDLYAYEVYKNGEKCSSLFVDALQGWFTDSESSVGDKYQIIAYYLSDGTCTELSKEFVNDGTSGIKEIGTTGDEGYILDGEKLLINGDNSKVALYNAAGVKLYEGTSSSLNLRGFGRGLFILKVYGNDGSEQTHKLMF